MVFSHLMMVYEQQVFIALVRLVDLGTMLELDIIKYVFLRLGCEAKRNRDARSVSLWYDC